MGKVWYGGREGQRDGGSDDRVTMTGMVIVCYCGVNPRIKV